MPNTPATVRASLGEFYGHIVVDSKIPREAYALGIQALHHLGTTPDVSDRDFELSHPEGIEGTEFRVLVGSSEHLRARAEELTKGLQQAGLEVAFDPAIERSF